MTEENKITPETVEKKKRKTKKEKYLNERENVLKKLNNIIGINDENNKFILEDLKKDIEKQKLIIGLEEEVKQFFVYNQWAYFNRKLENDWLCLMKNIYKDMEYELTYRQKCKDKVKFKEYSINKKP